MPSYSPSQLRAQIESLFEVVPERSSGDEVVFLCVEPGCNDVSGNRSVNLKTGLTNCWRCGKGGNFIQWCKRLGYPIELQDEPGVSAGELDAVIDSLSEKYAPRSANYVTSVKLPNGFTPLSQEPDGAYARLIGRMAKRKHLDLADFIEAGAGFTRVDRRWEPFCIFPVHEWGKVVYYQGRTYSDEPGQSTKRFPDRGELPMGSRYWWYNIDELREKGDTAIVVEAILNVRSLRRELKRRGINAVPIACFKHKISPEQLQKLAAIKGLKEVCLMFDADAITSAYSDCRRLRGRVQVSIVKMPVDPKTGKKVDPNDDAALAVDLFMKRLDYDELDGPVGRL